MRKLPAGTSTRGLAKGTSALCGPKVVAAEKRKAADDRHGRQPKVHKGQLFHGWSVKQDPGQRETS